MRIWILENTHLAHLLTTMPPLQAQASHDDRLSHANVTRHFDLLQHTSFVTSAANKLSPNYISHDTIAIDLDNVPLVERKYESSKKDKKDKAAAAGGVEAAKEGQQASTKEKKKKGGATPAVEGAAAVAVPTEAVTAAVAAGEGAAPGQPAQGKKEKKAKKEGVAAEGAEGGKPKKEKGGGGGGGKAPAEAEPITPGLIDMRVGKIVEGTSMAGIKYTEVVLMPICNR